ncbi:MAG: DUF190 domain-containing protein [Thermicanus sp.]|nr:DUF190 domain-containing protein [Thermicanus sp.]
MSLSGTEVVHLLLAASTLLFCARLLGMGMEKIGSPRVVGEIGAGILLGPSFFGMVFPDLWQWLFAGMKGEDDLLSLLYWLGFALLLFVTGYDMQFRFYKGEGKLITTLLLATTILPFSIGFFYSDLFPWRHYMGASGNDLSFSLVMGIIFSLTSIPVISKIFLDLHISHTSFAKIILMIAGFHDLILWGILSVALSVSVGTTLFVPSLYTYFVPILLLILLFGVILWRNGGLKFPQFPITIHEEGAIAFSLVFLWFFSSMIRSLGMDILLGALITGILMRTLVDAKQFTLGKSLHAISMSIFVPIYFALVGFQIDLRHPFPLLDFLLLFISATILQILLAWAGARFNGQSPRSALNFAAALNARGGPGIIVASVAYQAQVINGDLFTMFIFLSVLTSWMAGAWLKRVMKNKEPLMNELKTEKKPPSPFYYQKTERPLKQLAIYLHEQDRHRSEPLHHLILQNAREHNMLGVTVFRGIEGFGKSKRIQSILKFEALHHLPVMIQIIDSEEKISSFLPKIEALLREYGSVGGVFTLSSVEATFFHPERSR